MNTQKSRYRTKSITSDEGSGYYVKRLGQSCNTLKCDFTSNKLQLNEKYKKNFHGRVRFNSITITITTRSNYDWWTKGGDLSGSKSFIPDPVAVVACTIVQMKFRKKANFHTTICFVFKFRPDSDGRK